MKNIVNILPDDLYKVTAQGPIQPIETIKISKCNGCGFNHNSINFSSSTHILQTMQAFISYIKPFYQIFFGKELLFFFILKSQGSYKRRKKSESEFQQGHKLHADNLSPKRRDNLELSNITD